MKRLKTIEDLEQAIKLNKEIYFSLYHYPNEGKLFQQLINPEEHLEQLKIRIETLVDDPIMGVYSSEKIY